MQDAVNKIAILTNNPDVAAKYPKIACFLDVDVGGIFQAVRDAVHKGAWLVSHPLSGSIKPGESPYKSVAISANIGGLSHKSLQIIEDAIAVYKRLPSHNHRCYHESILADFRIIDLDIISQI